MGPGFAEVVWRLAQSGQHLVKVGARWTKQSRESALAQTLPASSGRSPRGPACIGSIFSPWCDLLSLPLPHSPRWTYSPPNRCPVFSRTSVPITHGSSRRSTRTGSPAMRCGWLLCLAQVSSFRSSMCGDDERTELYFLSSSQGTLSIKPGSTS